ncbi:hypothetical protein E3Q22_00360 [Wallemia mellicola]|uniref:Transcriptional regulatory protein RXT2 N-terminal domain-containing protein n=1 Tax=Wallemia mellicola TaxID=1708541 RepID=A0A4T0NSI1_9BASI|nr:hypothetical protein E3Q22_00360 [Wallemia mellicola]TIC00292.1 hypothetical protein E3Q18_01113 [Wallemia mellicola]TIC13708.1 hypothetical protein E3Q14_01133 [Wallemia mellicola]TIC53433.1 hypothetical protein E3Q04_03227 [Wallemia mellicola]TIC75468.1 hypothetical protein E3Q00_00973 [Wallemia mellicola]
MVKQLTSVQSLLSLPSNDQPQWYAAGPSTSSVILKNEVAGNQQTAKNPRGNRGRKLSLSNSLNRKGKISRWNPSSRSLEMDRAHRDQVKKRLSRFIPDEIELEYDSDDSDSVSIELDEPSWYDVIPQPQRLVDAVQSPHIKSSITCPRLSEFEHRSADVVENEKEITKSIGRALSNIYDTRNTTNHINELFISNTGVDLPTNNGKEVQDIHLTVEEQKVQAQRHIESLHEALADSREYIERMNELRSIIAETTRIKKSVWKGLRESVYLNLGGELPA